MPYAEGGWSGGSPTTGLALAASAGSAADADLAALVDARYDEAVALASDLFDYAELGYLETRSAERLAGYLENNGFRVESVPSPTSPRRSWRERGSGGPVIGILAEFDALARLVPSPGAASDSQSFPTHRARLAATICSAAPRPRRPW